MMSPAMHMMDSSRVVHPNVHAVVVTYNGASWIKECLESLVQSRHPVKIIVVDNGSRDATAEIVTRFSQVIFLPQRGNLGFAKANNIGIRMALAHGTEFVFLLNQDARVHPEAIGELVTCAREHEGFGILSPLHLNGAGTGIDRNFLRYIAEGAGEFCSDLYLGRRRRLYPIQYANAAAWLLTRECLNRVGGFDPIFFMYGEDNDFCHRAAFHKFGIGLVPSATIFHKRESPPLGGRWGRFRGRSMLMASQMLVLLKDPFCSFVRQLIFMSVESVHEGLRLLLFEDWQGVIALIFAALNVGVRLPLVWKRRKVSLSVGPHWM